MQDPHDIAPLSTVLAIGVTIAVPDRACWCVEQAAEWERARLAGTRGNMGLER
jgi:hypothetical protein